MKFTKAKIIESLGQIWNNSFHVSTHKRDYDAVVNAIEKLIHDIKTEKIDDHVEGCGKNDCYYFEDDYAQECNDCIHCPMAELSDNYSPAMNYLVKVSAESKEFVVRAKNKDHAVEDATDLFKIDQVDCDSVEEIK